MGSKNEKNPDQEVLQYLKDRPDRLFACSDLAKLLCADHIETRQALERLVKRKAVRTQMSSGRRKFGVMLPGYEKPEPEPEYPVTMRPYVMPKHMQELYEQIVEHRLMFPSKYDQ